ncbi:hypothetical protein QOT17_012822 [Balamuthia mandrillaris]
MGISCGEFKKQRVRTLSCCAFFIICGIVNLCLPLSSSIPREYTTALLTLGLILLIFGIILFFFDDGLVKSCYRFFCKKGFKLSKQVITRNESSRRMDYELWQAEIEGLEQDEYIE